MMIRRIATTALASVFVPVCAAWSQSPGGVSEPTPTSSARVETASLEILSPDRFLRSIELEPARRVALMATDDGIVQTLSANVGDTVRDSQEIVQLDRSEALARLKIAEAEVKEIESPEQGAASAVVRARLEAAQARADPGSDRSGQVHAPRPVRRTGAGPPGEQRTVRGQGERRSPSWPMSRACAC